MLSSGCGDRAELRRCRGVRAELAKQNAALRAREQAQKTVLARLQREAASRPTVAAGGGTDPAKGTPRLPVTNVLVGVEKNGKISFEGHAITLAQLKVVLTALHKKNPDARVLVNADVRAPHKHVFRLLDLAKNVGFKRIGIKTKAP